MKIWLLILTGLAIIGNGVISENMFNLDLIQKGEWKVPTINVTWNKTLREEADEITVRYEKIAGYPLNAKDSIKVFETYGRDHNFVTFPNLDYSSEYRITVERLIGNETFYHSTNKSIEKMVPKVISSSEAEIVLRHLTNAIQYQVFVLKMNGTDIKPTVSSITDETVKNMKNLYIAIMQKNMTIEDYTPQIIGDKSVYFVHTNYPLEENSQYVFFQRTTLTDGTIINYSWTDSVVTMKNNNTIASGVPKIVSTHGYTADVDYMLQEYASYYEFYVMKLESSTTKLPDPSTITPETIHVGDPVYIAMKVHSNELTLIRLGDGKNYTDHVNKPLLLNTFYAVFQRTYFEDEYPRATMSTGWSNVFQVVEEKPDLKPSKVNLDDGKILIITAGTVLGIIALICFIFCCCHYKYSKKYAPLPATKSGKTPQEQRLTADPSIPVTETNFYDHIAQMKFRNFKGFYEEFSLITKKTDFKPSEDFRHPDNIRKNRFVTVPCYDHSRVKLNGDDPVTTYIHANYVPGTDSEKDYILTQSPLPETIRDFWQMVFKENVSIIVMIGELIEKGNPVCAPYYPVNENRELDYFGKISLVKEHITADYAIRVLLLTIGEEVRTIFHFQFLSWPAIQITPPYPTAFLKFIKVILNSRSVQPEGPTIVHGTTASGRSGIYACVDSQIRRCVKQNDISVYDNVRSIHENRFEGIKTLDAYIFIHETILEFVLTRNIHDIPVQHLRTYIENAERGANDDELFLVEYKFLASTVVSSNQKMSAANLPANQKKNRYNNVKPFDHNRVKISKLATNSDYINASWVDSYLNRQAFITTQAPLVDTLGDFWRMIHESESWVIVMLGQEIENGQLKADRFWPEEGLVMALDYLSIKLLSINNDVIKDVIVRQIEIMDTKTSNTKLIQMYQYLKWPSHKDITSESIHSLVLLTQQSASWRDQLKAKCITIVSSSGIGRPGVLIALQSLQEECENEGSVNIFRTVQRLRQQRTALIQTREEYVLIYISALELTKHVRRRSFITSPIDLTTLGIEILPSGYMMCETGGLCERLNSMSETSAL